MPESFWIVSKSISGERRGPHLCHIKICSEIVGRQPSQPVRLSVDERAQGLRGGRNLSTPPLGKEHLPNEGDQSFQRVGRLVDHLGLKRRPGDRLLGSSCLCCHSMRQRPTGYKLELYQGDVPEVLQGHTRVAIVEDQVCILYDPLAMPIQLIKYESDTLPVTCECNHPTRRHQLGDIWTVRGRRSSAGVVPGPASSSPSGGSE